MSIVSFWFLAFVAVTFILYYVLPKRVRWCVLLAASLAFYAFRGVEYLAYIGGSVLVSWLVGLAISRDQDRQKKLLSQPELDKAQIKEIRAAGQHRRRLWLAAGISAVLAVLIFVKYYNFTAENINNAIGIFVGSAGKMPVLDIVMPMGISFYTFSIVAYLVDLYRGKYPAQKNAAKYALFVSYFPHIFQGPIDRYDKLAPQLLEARAFDFKTVKFGAQRMLWGFFKKLVIADRLALFVNTVYDPKPEQPPLTGSI